jgi:hypothetical protein
VGLHHVSRQDGKLISSWPHEAKGWWLRTPETFMADINTTVLWVTRESRARVELLNHHTNEFTRVTDVGVQDFEDLVAHGDSLILACVRNNGTPGLLILNLSDGQERRFVGTPCARNWRPVDIAVHTNDLYVCDMAQSCVWVFQ